MACDFACHNVYSFFLCSGQVDPIHGVLSAFPLSFVVYLFWFQHVTLEFFFNLVSPGIQESEEHSLSSFSAFFTSNESRLQD